MEATWEGTGKDGCALKAGEGLGIPLGWAAGCRLRKHEELLEENTLRVRWGRGIPCGTGVGSEWRDGGAGRQGEGCRFRQGMCGRARHILVSGF